MIEMTRQLPDGTLQHGATAYRRHGNGRRDFHPTIGRGRLVAPDGTILWLGEWVENAVHDQGEKDMLDVYLRAQSNPSKYLALASQGSVTALADTVVMSGITEPETPGVDNYNRQLIAAGDWSVPTLDSGDMRTTATIKTFGPNTGGVAWSISHTILTTASTGTAGLLILSVPLSSLQAVATGIAFTHELSWKQQ